MSQTPSSGPLDPILDILRETELFGGLPDDQLRRVATVARRQRVSAGTAVVNEGEPSRTCFVVRSGNVEVDEAGGGPRLVGRGEVFAVEALAREAPSRVSARARDDTELLAIPGDDVRRLILTDSLATRILRHLRSDSAAPPVAAPAPEAPAPEPRPAAAGDDAVSRRLQRLMVPRNAPRLPGYDIAAGTTAEDHGAGGTVWDSVELADGRVALVVLDVRTGGQPRAHLLGMARVALRAAARGADGLAGVLAGANAAITPVVPAASHQFVECALVAPSDGGVEWASAGRMPAGVLGRAGTLQALGSHGPPLGMLEGFRYASEAAEMGVGDALLVLSSGSTGLFRGAADLVAQVQEKTAGEVVSTVHRGLRRAQGETPPEVTVLFLRKH